MDVLAIVVTVLVIDYINFRSKVNKLEMLTKNFQDALNEKKAKEMIDEDNERSVSPDEECEILAALKGLPSAISFPIEEDLDPVSIKQVALHFDRSEVEIIEIFIRYLNRQVENLRKT